MGTSRADREIPHVLTTVTRGRQCSVVSGVRWWFSRTREMAASSAVMPFSQTCGSSSVMRENCKTPPMVETMASTGWVPTTRHWATAAASCALPCTTFRFGNWSAGSRSVSLDGVRQSAMQVWPAASARVSAPRPMPPEAPMKAVSLVLLDEAMLICFGVCVSICRRFVGNLKGKLYIL